LVDTLESYVELVLNALDHPDALVTDLSTVGDFGLDADERFAASARLGVTVSDDDHFYEVAQHLRDKPRGYWGSDFVQSELMW
jgi:hypothetical protein